MSDASGSGSLTRLLMGAAALVLVFQGISDAQSVLASFLVSVFFAVLAMPSVLWLRRRGLPVTPAVFLVVGGMVMVVLAAAGVIGASLSSFSEALPQYQARVQEHLVAFKAFLAARKIAPKENLLDYANPGALVNFTAGVFMRLSSVASNAALIVLTAAFILFEAESFPIKLRAVLGRPHQDFPQVTRFTADMKSYVVIKTLISLATGVLVTIWMLILGVDFAVLWGFVAFLFNFIPTVGSSMAAIPAVLLAFLQLGVGRALGVAAGYVVVNAILDYGVEKRLMGRKLGLSTLVVFLSLIFWGTLLGPTGAVLCIPLTMTLKFAFENNESTRWVAVLLGPEEAVSEPVAVEQAVSSD